MENLGRSRNWYSLPFCLSSLFTETIFLYFDGLRRDPSSRAVGFGRTIRRLDWRGFGERRLSLVSAPHFDSIRHFVTQDFLGLRPYFICFRAGSGIRSFIIFDKF